MPCAYSAMSAIVFGWAGSALETNAPSSQLIVSGEVSSAAAASSRALARIFPVALWIAAGVCADRRGVVAVTGSEPVLVGRHDLDVERRDAELGGDELRVASLLAVGLGGQAEHHLAGRVDPQEHRPVRLVGHHSSSSVV